MTSIKKLVLFSINDWLINSHFISVINVIPTFLLYGLVLTEYVIDYCSWNSFNSYLYSYLNLILLIKNLFQIWSHAKNGNMLNLTNGIRSIHASTMLQLKAFILQYLPFFYFALIIWFLLCTWRSVGLNYKCQGPWVKEKFQLMSKLWYERCRFYSIYTKMKTWRFPHKFIHATHRYYSVNSLFRAGQIEKKKRSNIYSTKRRKFFFYQNI